jgi:phage shock protein A
MFKRIANLIRGFFGLFIGGLERRSPEALLDVQRESLRKEIANYNQGLAAHAGMCEGLMAKVTKLTAEEKDTRAKATAHLRAGNKDAAGQYALKLQAITAELAETHQKADEAGQTYQKLLRARDMSVKAAQEKIESLKDKLGDLKVEKANASLQEMATGMVGSIGSAGEALDRLQNMVEEERTKAAGRARVAKDSLNITDITVKEGETKALQDQALADFAAKEGLALEDTPKQALLPPHPRLRLE